MKAVKVGKPFTKTKTVRAVKKKPPPGTVIPETVKAVKRRPVPRFEEGGDSIAQPNAGFKGNEFGVAANYLSFLDGYGKTREEAEKSPYYENRLDLGQEDVYQFMIEGLKDDLNDEGKKAMLDHMAEVKWTDESGMFSDYQSRYNPVKKDVYIDPHSLRSSWRKGSTTGEEFVHSLQDLDKGPEYASPPLINEIQQMLNASPEGYLGDRISLDDTDVWDGMDSIYYGGCPKGGGPDAKGCANNRAHEFEAMMMTGLMQSMRMGLIPEGEKITREHLPGIMERYNSLVTDKKTKEQMIGGEDSAVFFGDEFHPVPRHARNFMAVVNDATLGENAKYVKEGEALDNFLKVLNRELTVNPIRFEEYKKKE